MSDVLSFSPFRLDPANAQLWRGAEAIALRRKTFAVLHYLVAHAGQLVTKEQLLDALWSGAYVSDTMPALCIRELRQALGDEAKTPRFIETVHGRGYRFLPAVTTQPVSSSQFKGPRSATQDSTPRTQPSVLVGRETELAQLHGWFDKALHGELQLVFVTGEAGIGKTTVVEAFLTDIGQQGTGNGEQGTRNRSQRKTNPTQLMLDARSLTSSPWIGRGQCIEHYGAGEAYLPILEALGRLTVVPGTGRKTPHRTFGPAGACLVSADAWAAPRRRTGGTATENPGRYAGADVAGVSRGAGGHCGRAAVDHLAGGSALE